MDKKSWKLFIKVLIAESYQDEKGNITISKERLDEMAEHIAKETKPKGE